MNFSHVIVKLFRRDLRQCMKKEQIAHRMIHSLCGNLGLVELDNKKDAILFHRIICQILFDNDENKERRGRRAVLIDLLRYSSHALYPPLIGYSTLGDEKTLREMRSEMGFALKEFGNDNVGDNDDAFNKRRKTNDDGDDKNDDGGSGGQLPQALISASLVAAKNYPVDLTTTVKEVVSFCRDGGEEKKNQVLDNTIELQRTLGPILDQVIPKDAQVKAHDVIRLCPGGIDRTTALAIMNEVLKNDHRDDDEEENNTQDSEMKKEEAINITQAIVLRQQQTTQNSNIILPPLSQQPPFSLDNNTNTNNNSNTTPMMLLSDEQIQQIMVSSPFNLTETDLTTPSSESDFFLTNMIDTSFVNFPSS